jgi:hypothetical protein
MSSRLGKGRLDGTREEPGAEGTDMATCPRRANDGVSSSLLNGRLRIDTILELFRH